MLIIKLYDIDVWSSLRIKGQEERELNFPTTERIPTKEIEDYKKDMDHLLKLIRNFNDKKIYLLSLYKGYNISEEELNDMNLFLKQASEKYHMIYIDIQNITENPQYFLLNNSYYLNYKGHNEIANRIISTINS